MATATAGRATLLNQIVAVEGGLKARTKSAVDAAYHRLQKIPPMEGIARTYRPGNDEGEQLPSQYTLVQVRVDEILEDVAQALTRLMDVTLTKDVANTAAKADIVIGGQVLVADVPVTTLMTLEKQIVDVHTIIAKVPTLDIAEKWEFDRAADAWATPVLQTTRTKKIPRNHVLAPATDRHPAQVQVWQEDVVVGIWDTIKYSGAMPAARKQALLDRVNDLLDAIRVARESANQIAVEQKKMGEALFEYLLAP